MPSARKRSAATAATTQQTAESVLTEREERARLGRDDAGKLNKVPVLSADEHRAAVERGERHPRAPHECDLQPSGTPHEHRGERRQWYECTICLRRREERV